MGEFTGERVIPGAVDADLWNEHLARYAFAARLARGKRVLDAGCGTGYGAARLAAGASRVVGLDLAQEAVEAAARDYQLPGLDFLRGDCRELPFPHGAFGLVVAFEVIEHLQRWERLLVEARRVLAPQGELVVSTPNRLYYAESREFPNPFHVHEFDYAEFCEALGEHFPHIQVFQENHADGVVFAPADATGVETTIESAASDPDSSHFFVAVCSTRPIHRSPAFVYFPRAGNVLREREKHIALLADELEQKNRWLDQARESLDKLHRAHQALEQEAAEERRRAQEVIQSLEEENLRKTEWGRLAEAEIERLKGILEKLQAEFEEQTAWAVKLDAERAQLSAAYEKLGGELKVCVDQLHLTEAELEERTRWARGLERRVEQLTADLNSLLGSPAYRIGKRLGLAPIPPSDPRGGKAKT